MGKLSQQSGETKMDIEYDLDSDSSVIYEKITIADNSDTTDRIMNKVRQNPTVMILLTILFISALITMSIYPDILSVIMMATVIMVVGGVFNAYYMKGNEDIVTLKAHTLESTYANDFHRVLNKIRPEERNQYIKKTIELIYEVYDKRITRLDLVEWLNYVESAHILHPTIKLDWDAPITEVEEIYNSLTAQTKHAKNYSVYSFNKKNTEKVLDTTTDTTETSVKAAHTQEEHTVEENLGTSETNPTETEIENIGTMMEETQPEEKVTIQENVDETPTTMSETSVEEKFEEETENIGTIEPSSIETMDTPTEENTDENIEENANMSVDEVDDNPNENVNNTVEETAVSNNDNIIETDDETGKENVSNIEESVAHSEETKNNTVIKYYHINQNTLNPNICKNVSRCKFVDENGFKVPHYENREDALIVSKELRKNNPNKKRNNARNNRKSNRKKR